MNLTEIVERAIPLNYADICKCPSTISKEENKAKQRRIILRQQILDLIERAQQETIKQTQSIRYY